MTRSPPNSPERSPYEAEEKDLVEAFATLRRRWLVASEGFVHRVEHNISEARRYRASGPSVLDVIGSSWLQALNLLTLLVGTRPETVRVEEAEQSAAVEQPTNEKDQP